MKEVKKAVTNFTAEQSAKLQSDYTKNPTKETVAALAAEMGKSTRSIIAKLVNLGVYQKPAKDEASEGKAETKGEIVAQIAKTAGVAEEVFSSLEGATKKALLALRDALNAKADSGEASAA